MKKNILLIVVFVFMFLGLFAQDYEIDTENGNTLNVCSGTLYDSGGPSGDYSANEDYTVTICAPAGQHAYLNFLVGETENNYDYVYIYDGSSTASPQIGGSPFSGTFSGNVTATGTCLTIRFTSDGSIYDDGFEAVISCVTDPGPPITVNGCTGTFYDLAGPGADYQDNQTQIWTFCPDIAGMAITFDFTEWDVNGAFVGNDNLVVYDGPDTSSPVVQNGNENNPILGLVQASSVNASGCLTFEWTSDNDGITGAGWLADISCMLPCQQVQVSQNSSPLEVGGYIDICQGTTVNFNGVGIYPENNTIYTQSDATSTFEWDFGDGSPVVTGQNVSHTFPTEGGYDINLEITDVNGCHSTNDLGLRVRVSTTPTFDGTIAATDPVCLGDCSSLTGTPNMTTWTTPPGQVLAGLTPLPDGSGVTYTTCLTFDNFVPGATVTSVGDIVDLCINMEHSFIGDLIVTIDCPDGSSTILFDGNNDPNLAEWLGNPIDNNTGTPGTGLDYCFNMTTATTDITQTGVGNSNSIATGDYTPEGTWADLIGCPLNGDWCINILDDQSMDDGFIFAWGITFDPNLYPDGWGFTPNVVSDSWSGTTVTAGNPTTACPPDLGTESYTYTIVDNFGCSYDTTISITAVGLDVTTAFTDPSCNGGTDGTASVTNVTGNVGAVSYHWSSGQTTAAITGLGAGTYTVTITDGGASCTNVQTIILTDPPALNISLTPTSEVCGASNGEINVNITGGAGLIDYVWQVTAGAGTTNGSINNQATPYDITGLQASSYSVTATDNNGCSVVGTVVVAGTGNVTAGFSTSGNQCLEGNSFDFTNTTGTTGGTVTITYDVVAPVGGTSAPGLIGTPNYSPFIADAPGTWTVTQTVVDGACTDSQTLTFTVYDEPQLSLVATDMTCNSANTGSGTSDGAITASVTNSNGSETYTFISGTGSFTGNTASGLTANTYDVVIVDMQGCNDTAQIIINEPPVITLSLTSTNNICNGVPCNGTANVATVTGGVGPFSYQWSTTETTQNISNLCAGTYNVTVYDSNSPSNGCYEIGTQIITEPPMEVYTNSSTDATCGLATGSATINVTTVPASSTYEYTWYSDAGLTTQIDFSPASASTTNTTSNVAAGTYYVQVENASGCTDVIAVTVNDNGSPTLNLTSSTDILCNGEATGQITVDITGTLNPNFTYTWDDGSGPVVGLPTAATTDQQTGLSAGTYDITVTDNAGCQSSVNVVLLEPTLMTGNVTVVDANCAALGSVTANVANGTVTGTYTYDWDNDGIGDMDDAANVSVGTGVYNVTVYDDNNCELYLSGTVNDVGGITATSVVNSNTLCNGSSEGSITASPTGGTAPFTFAWTPIGFTNGNTDTYSDLPVGTYNCVVTDANGCSANTSGVITEPTEVHFVFVDSSMVSCFAGTDGDITVDGIGGTAPYIFNWDLAAANQTTAQASNLGVGCYTVTVEDNNHCTEDTTICIHEPTQLVLTVDTYDAHCDQADGSASVNIVGGTAPYPTITWSAGIPTAQPDSITGLAFGSYSVTVIDNNGCSEIANFNIDSISRGVISIATYTDVSCFGGNDGLVQVSVGGGGGTNSFVWAPAGFTDGGATYSDLTQGTYNVTATDIWGCELHAQQTIIEPTQLTLTINRIDDRCNGTCEGTADAVVGGGTAPYFCQWDDASLSTTSGITGLCAGWYRVTVTDANGCSIIDSTEISEPLSMTLTANIDSSSCGQDDGKIAVYPINGTAPYSFLWSPNPTGSVIDSLEGIPQGSYCVTITDSKNCPFDSCFVVIDQNSPTAQIDSILNPLCNGDNNGTAYASATGGVLPYTWAWSSDSVGVTSISNVASNLDGGNVCVTVTDFNGCQSTACTTLVENPELIVNISTVDVLCQSDSTGQASAVVIGGTGIGTYTYSWNGLYTGTSPNDATADSIPSGTYSLLVTDTNGCINLTNNIIINEPTHISLSSTFTPVLCNGACDGTGTIIASGGEGSYTYVWPDGQTSETASGLCAGMYTPTVIDGYGCEDSTVISISEPTPFVLDSIVYEHISCYGSCDASIVTYVSGGTLNYFFQYDGPSGYSETTQTVSSLCLAGNYSIHVEDANGCPIDTFHIVNQPPELLESNTHVDETCYGYCDGEIHVTVIGGTGNYSVDWSDGIDADNIDRVDLCPGTYSYTVTDEHLCTVSNTVTIAGNPLLDIIEASVTPATCGQCDGAATVSLFGGVTPYTISWFGGDFSSCSPATPYPDGGNTLTQTQLPQGIHSVYVEDGNGCRDTVDIAINNLTGPTIDDVTVTDVLCNGDATGTITVAVSGGTGTVNYTWDGGTTGSTLIPNSLNQPNVYAGTYYFSATDVSGCVASTVINVNENPEVLINITNINNATCNGYTDGSATIQGFGGTGVGTYSYSWNTIPIQNTVTATGLGVGTYQGVVTDINGCSASEVFTISEPAAITLQSQNVTQTTCAFPQICDGSVQVVSTGGNSSVYNYNWFGNGSNQNTTGSLCPGTYQLQITDVEGCFGDFTFVVGQPDTIHVVLGQDPIACNDPNGMVWIESVTGGTGSAYYNTVFDKRDNLYPLGGANGWTCTWDVAATQLAYVDGVFNQTYSVQVYDPNNTQCSVTQTITVGEVPEPYLFSQQTQQTSCNGMSDGQVRIEVKQGTPEFHYNWSFGNNIPFPTGADTVLITNLAAGTYTLTVVDDNGCEVPTSFIIIEPNPISVSTTLVPDDIICISQSAVVYANGSGGTPSYEYNWDGGLTWTPNSALMISPINDTIVYLTIKDKNDCQASTQRVIYVNDSLQVEAIADGEICQGDSYTLDVVYNNGGNGTYSYFWSSGSDLSQHDVSPSSSQVYYITLADNCGTPPVIDSVSVIVNPNPYVQTITQRDSCEPLGMVFVPYPEDNNVHYHWNFGDPQSGNNESTDMYPSHLFQYAGTYDIKLDLLTDKGCSYDTTFSNWIIVYPLPMADLGMNPNPASLFNNTVTFTDLTVSEDAIDNIQWDFGNGENASFMYLGSKPKSIYDHPGYYDIVLFAETRNGCKDTVRKVLRVNDEYTIYAPDAFSPGQDGRNDYFYPLGHGIDGTKEYELVIYDRWGLEIFKTDKMPYGTDKTSDDFDPDLIPEDQRGWNGKYNNVGEYVQNDVYTWAVKLVDVNGVSHEASGRVTVIR